MYIAARPPGRVDPDHHITLTFHGKGEKKQDYMRAVVALAHTAQWWHANGNGQIPVHFGDTGYFEQGVWYAKVNSPKLFRFQERLCQELDRLGVYHAKNYEFKPHLTLAYGGDSGIENPYVGTTCVLPTFSVIPTSGSTLEPTDIHI